MSDERLVNEAAAWLLAIMEDPRSPGDYIEWARNLLVATSLDDPHCGDCTDVPMTCNRCLTDDYRGAAIALLTALRPVIERETLERAAEREDNLAKEAMRDARGIKIWSDSIRYEEVSRSHTAAAARIRALIPKENDDHPKPYTGVEKWST